MEPLDGEGFCDCVCRHKYGQDLGEDCTDDRCGYCGTEA